MKNYLLICTSLTYAQRMAALLSRSGISGTVVRTPSEFAVGGCGYSVRVQERHLERAKAVAQSAGLRIKQVVELPARNGRGRAGS